MVGIVVAAQQATIPLRYNAARDVHACNCAEGARMTIDWKLITNVRGVPLGPSSAK